jgi:hypothetical protein
LHEEHVLEWRGLAGDDILADKIEFQAVESCKRAEKQVKREKTVKNG